MHKTGFKAIQVVYKRLWCIEESRAPHSVCVLFESIAESNTLIKMKDAEGVI